METTRPSLLIRIRDLQNANAWTEFDAIYRPILRRFALAQRLSETEADEIVQDCMAALVRGAPHFHYDPGRGHFRSWLFTLVSNRVRNLRRDQREVTSDNDFLDQRAGRELTPSQVFDLIWAQEHLTFCLARLRAEVDPETYAAFDLHVLQGLDVEAVCRQRGISRNRLYTIKWRLSQKLAERIRSTLSFC